MLFIGIYFKMFAASGRHIGHSLIRQIDFYLCLVILVDTLKQLSKEHFRHNYRQYKVIQFVIFVDIGEERADYNPETIAGYRPCSVLPTRSGAEILAHNQ